MWFCWSCPVAGGKTEIGAEIKPMISQRIKHPRALVELVWRKKGLFLIDVQGSPGHLGL